MPRNRMIKPEFWADEKMGSCSPIAQLLYIGSWNFSDDWGVCRANALYLRNNIFPYSSITIKQIENALQELIDKKRIFLGEHNGESYFFIPKFEEHQKIDRPSKFRHIPENLDYKTIFGHSTSIADTLATDSTMKEKDKDKEKEESKSKYLDAVFLSENEYKKLFSEVDGNGNKKYYQSEKQLNKGIELLNNYIMSKGKKYKSHYHVLIGWVLEKVKQEPEQKKSENQYAPLEFKLPGEN